MRDDCHRQKINTFVAKISLNIPLNTLKMCWTSTGRLPAGKMMLDQLWNNVGVDKKIQHDVLILDFQKAFNKVPHQRLLIKLDHCGVRGSLNRWMSNWLTDRYQKVVVEGATSDEVRVTSGVPQRTVLGPLMLQTFAASESDPR